MIGDGGRRRVCNWDVQIYYVTQDSVRKNINLLISSELLNTVAAIPGFTL